MSAMSYLEAGKLALAQEMRRDATVWALGEDLGRGGVFGQYKGLVEEFGRPTVLIGLDGDQGKGSGRSISRFDLHAGNGRCRHLLERFGNTVGEIEVAGPTLFLLQAFSENVGNYLSNVIGLSLRTFAYEAPREAGWFIPEPAAGKPAPQTNDVDVDERGLVYIVDRYTGFDILEFSAG